MTTTAEKRNRIDAINTILQTGVRSNSVDGESTTFDHDSLRRERNALQVELGRARKRNRVFNLNMNGR